MPQIGTTHGCCFMKAKVVLALTISPPASPFIAIKPMSWSRASSASLMSPSSEIDENGNCKVSYFPDSTASSATVRRWLVMPINRIHPFFWASRSPP